MASKDTKKITEGTIDWLRLKSEFFRDSEETVSGFLRKKLGIQKPTTKEKRKTKGWTEEKRQFIEETLEWAKTNLQARIWEAYAVPMEQLNKLKKWVFDILFARLSQISNNVKIEVDPETGKQSVVLSWAVPTKELIEILKVVKTELWEATNISQWQLWEDEKKLVREISSVKIV